MTQLTQNTFTNVNQNENLYINYAINNVLLNLNTFMPAQITAIDGLRCTVQTIINTIAVNQTSPAPMQVANVPICQLIGGDSGIIIEYQVGDVVLCGAIQRDISAIKDTWQQANPPSARKFSISDVVVLFKLSNSLPTNFVEITSGGINITAPGLPVNINSDTANINANTVNLGTGAANSVLLEGVSMNVTIAGVQAGGGVSTTMTVASGGSSKVKGAI